MFIIDYLNSNKSATFSSLTVTGDLTVNGNLNFGDTTTDVLTIAGYMQGDASGNTLVKIGNGTPLYLTTPATNDLFVSGSLEVAKKTYFQAQVVNYSLLYLAINYGAAFSGTISTRGGYTYRTNEGCYLVVGSTNGHGNHAISIISGSYSSSNFGHNSLLTNPTLFIHSATDPATDNTQYISLSHNQTHGVIEAGKGNLILTATATATGNADLSASQISFYLDETGNTLTVKAKYSDGTTVKTGTVSLV